MEWTLPIVLRLGMTILCAAQFVCSMLALVTSDWVIFSMEENGHNFNTLSIGLWKECGLDTENIWKCSHISNDMLLVGHVGRWMSFVRAFIILAVIADVVAVLIIFVTFFWKPKLYFTSSIASLLAGVFTCAAVAIFHRDNKWTKLKMQPFSYGWSFTMAIVSIVLSVVVFLTGLFIFVYADKKEVQKVSYKQHQSLKEPLQTCDV